MKTELKGILEIDHYRGVIYFHLSEPEDIKRLNMMTPLRICQLPTPIPEIKDSELDLTHMVGISYRG